MMSSTLRRLAVVSFVAFALTNLRPANAELVLEFGRNGVPGIENFSMVPGSSLELDLFLTQKPNEFTTDSGTVFIPDNRLTDRGLSVAWFSVGIDRMGLAHDPFVVDDPSASVVIGDGFALDADSSAAVSAQSISIAIDAPRTETSEGPDYQSVFPATGESSVFLASARFTLDPTATGEFVLELSPLLSDSSSFVLGDAELDDFVSATSAFATVTAVPEPSGPLGLAFVGAMGIGFYRSRRRRRRFVGPRGW